jgi:hypothetical protein
MTRLFFSDRVIIKTLVAVSYRSPFTNYTPKPAGY